MRFFYIFLIFICAGLYCNEIEKPSNQKKISLKDVKALILMEDSENLKSRSCINASGIILLNVKIPGQNSKAFFKKIEKEFLGQEKDIDDLKNEIYKYFNENGEEVVITTPAQNFRNGILKLIVEKEVFIIEKPALKVEETKKSSNNLSNMEEIKVGDSEQKHQTVEIPKVSLKNIEAIILAKDGSIFNTKSFINAKGILLSGAEIPGKKSEFVQALEKFLNSPYQLSDLINEIKRFFAVKGFDVSIDLPKQKYNYGLIKIVLNTSLAKKDFQPEEKTVTAEAIKVEAPAQDKKEITQNSIEDSKAQENACEKIENQPVVIIEDKKAEKEEIIPKVSLRNVEAIVFAKDSAIFNKKSFVNAKGILIAGAEVPGKKGEFVEGLERFLNSTYELSDVVEEIKSYYADENFDIIVKIPSQKFNLGILKLVISAKAKINSSESFKKEKIKAKQKKIENKKVSEDKNEKAEGLYLPKLNSILLLSEKEEKIDLESEAVKDAASNDANDIVVKGVDIPNFKVLRAKLTPFLNKPLNKDDIVCIKQLIILHYKKNCRPFVVVLVPEQKITNGQLKLVIFESKIGEVCVVGNKYFSNKQYDIGLKTGDSLNEEKLIRKLNFLNRNPFRNVEMIYKEGKEKGTTDIEIVAKEIRPMKIYYGAENTGLDLIGKNRFLAGVHMGNLFWSSQVLSYQITKSFASNSFEAHTMQYTIPCPWGHLVYFYGGYSKVHAEIPVFKTAKNKGKSYQASFRYEEPLKTYGFYTHNFIFGFDYKKTNNSAEFVEILRFGKFVNLTQLYLTYEGNLMLKGYMSSFDVNVYVSPGKWLEGQSNSAYRTIRLHSRSDYVYTRIDWKNLVSFYRDLSLSFFFSCQFANTNLLPSEEFGIGGYNTVRGYDERDANGDNGVLLSTELRLPSFSIFRYWNKRINDRLQFLGFVDYGKVWVHEKEEGLPGKAHLLGIGPGLRYVIDPYLSLRIDYGWKMHRLHNDFIFEKKRKLHFGLNISY